MNRCFIHRTGLHRPVKVVGGGARIPRSSAMALVVSPAGSVSDHGAAHRGDRAAADRRTYRCARSSAYRLGLRGTSGNAYE
jgi:hypothetical protein